MCELVNSSLSFWNLLENDAYNIQCTVSVTESTSNHIPY